MKNFRINTFLFVLIAATIYVACRKVDHQASDEVNPSQIEAKFFNSHRTADPIEKTLVDFLKRVNDKSSFVEKTVKQIGFPRWDKIITPSDSRRAGKATSDSSGITYYIPFVRDSQNYVNASIAIRATQTDTTFSYLCDWQYAEMQNNTTNTQDTAEFFAIFFMSFDRHVFGYTHFDIIDKDLFKNGNNEARQVIFSDTQTTSGKSNILAPIEVCADVNVPYTVCSTPDHSNCIPNCDECAICTAVAVLTYCWTEYIDDGSGGGTGGTGGSGGGGSSGGGGGNNTPPPCGNPPVATKGAVQEGCQSGWTPTGGGSNSDDPCSRIDANSGANATLKYSGWLKPTAQGFTPFDPNTNSQPEEYFVVNDINGSYVPGPIQTLPTTGGSMQGIINSTVIIVHMHPYGGFPFPSPADFFGLANFGSNFQMSYVLGYDGTKYAMVINDYPQLQTFVGNNSGAVPIGSASFDPLTSLGQQSNTMRNRLVAQGYSADEAYERTLAYIMKQAGVTLVKSTPGSDTFKKIGLRQKIINGVPQVNVNGDPIYENADC